MIKLICFVDFFEVVCGIEEFWLLLVWLFWVCSKLLTCGGFGVVGRLDECLL